MERRPLGMGDLKSGGTGNARAEVERTFSPEFRNRLDAIVFFNPLDPVTVAQVVGKQIMELETQLLAKGVEVEFDPEVREWLAQKGYDRALGARPMNRLIQDQIKKPLANEILFGRLESGGHVRVILKDGAPAFEIEGKPTPAESGTTEPSKVV
jgi:ATP-dependent Clp protease ATP-binding subunit ClpA